MAKQKAQYYIGRRGNTIWYQLNGGFYIRSMPQKVRQTAATKIRSANFSVAAGAGRTLRASLHPALPFPKNKKMQNSFAGAVMKWLQIQTPEQLQPSTHLPYLQNFQFNDATSVQERWKVALTVTKQANDLLQVHVPAFIPVEKMAAPAWTNSVICTIAAGSCTLKNSISNGSSLHTFTISYNAVEIPVQIINLPLAMPAGSLVLVAVSLTYTVSKKGNNIPTDNIAFMPSGIVSAMYV